MAGGQPAAPCCYGPRGMRHLGIVVRQAVHFPLIHLRETGAAMSRITKQTGRRHHKSRTVQHSLRKGRGRRRTFHSLMVLSFVERMRRLELGWFTQRTLLIFSSISKDFK